MTRIIEPVMWGKDKEKDRDKRWDRDRCKDRRDDRCRRDWDRCHDRCWDWSLVRFTNPSVAEVDSGWILIDGVNVRYSGQRSVRSRTATTNRTVRVVTHDRDLDAIAGRVVTLASPRSRGWPGVHRSTQLQ